MKSKVISSLLFAVLVAVLVPFSTALAQHQNHSNHEQHQKEQGKKASFKDQKLENAYQHYIHTKEALVASDAKEAKKGAEALEAALKQLPGTEKVVAVVNKVASTANINEQRKAFATVSVEMARLVNKDAVTSGTVYVAYCPMANNNKGAYWLSNEKEIRNPYFGDSMLKCGSVKETIQK